MKMVKLKSQAGFTFSEMLITVFIMSLVSAITAAGIPTIKNTYDKVVVAANAEVLLSTAVTELRDKIGTAWNVRVATDRETIEFFSADTGANTIIKKDDMAVGGVRPIYIEDYASYTIDGIITVDKSEDKSKERKHRLITNEASTKDLYIVFDKVKKIEGKPDIIEFTGLEVVMVKPDGGNAVLAKYGNDSTLRIKVASGDIKRSVEG